MFLTALAVHGEVAPSTQNQAMNALVFLYKRVLAHALQCLAITQVATPRCVLSSAIGVRLGNIAPLSLVEFTTRRETKNEEVGDGKTQS